LRTHAARKRYKVRPAKHQRHTRRCVSWHARWIGNERIDWNLPARSHDHRGAYVVYVLRALDTQVMHSSNSDTPLSGLQDSALDIAYYSTSTVHTSTFNTATSNIPSQCQSPAVDIAYFCTTSVHTSTFKTATHFKHIHLHHTEHLHRRYDINALATYPTPTLQTPCLHSPPPLSVTPIIFIQIRLIDPSPIGHHI
jgi:hypothetical protein